MFYAVILIFCCIGLICSEKASLSTESIPNKIETNDGSKEYVFGFISDLDENRTSVTKKASNDENFVNLDENSAEGVAGNLTEPIKQLQGTDKAEDDVKITIIAKKPSNNEKKSKLIEKSDESVEKNSKELIKLEDTHEDDENEITTSIENKSSNDENSSKSIQTEVKRERVESDYNDDDSLIEEYEASDELKIMTKSRLNAIFKKLNNKIETRSYTFELQKDRHPNKLSDLIKNLTKKMEEKPKLNNPNILRDRNQDGMQNQNIILREQRYNGMLNHNKLRHPNYNGLEYKNILTHPNYYYNGLHYPNNILTHPNYNGMQYKNIFTHPNYNGMLNHNLYSGQTYNGIQNPLSNIDLTELNRDQTYELINKVTNQLCSNIKQDVFKAISQNQDNLFSRQSQQLHGDITYKIIANPLKTFGNIVRIKISIPPNASAENKHSLVCRYDMKRLYKTLAKPNRNPNLITQSKPKHDRPINIINGNDDYHYSYYWEKELNEDYGARLLSNEQ